MNKNRINQSTYIIWVNEYSLLWSNVLRWNIDELLKKYNEALLRLIDFKKQTPKTSENYKIIAKQYEDEALQFKIQLTNELSKYNELNNRNVLELSNKNVDNIWHWQDNVVFLLRDGYVYKESTQLSSPEHHTYLVNKYLLLKAYLGKNVPKTYFILWESLKQLKTKDKKLAQLRRPVLSELTIQKRIKGPNLSQMTEFEKENPDFQEKLEKAHKKYILLKIFLDRIHRMLDFTPGTLDLKLDLWSLSDKDSIKAELMNTKLLTTPNIMWNGSNIYFIDFDFWIWDERKQVIFEYMLHPKMLNEWHKILSIYELN